MEDGGRAARAFNGDDMHSTRHVLIGDVGDEAPLLDATEASRAILHP